MIKPCGCMCTCTIPCCYHTQGVVLEEHSVECVTSGEKRLLPPAVVSSGVVRLMSFTAFSAASVKSKVRFLSSNGNLKLE